MIISNLTKIAELSKQEENTVGKREIACYEQFLLFPQCFQKACIPGASKGVIVWEWVNEICPLVKLKLNTFDMLRTKMWDGRTDGDYYHNPRHLFGGG